MKRWKRLGVVAGALALVGSGMLISGVAIATPTPPTYSACLAHSTGTLYNVKVNATPTCVSTKDMVITWNQQGPPGTNGNTVLNGTGAPTSAIGNNGDFYIDTSTDTLYGPKASGAWPTPGTSLVGAKGDTGAPGPSNLAALQGSACTFNGHPSTLTVITDSTTGVVTLTCKPVDEVSATVTGGTVHSIQITDFTNSSGNQCDTGGAVSSCSYLATSGDDVSVSLQTSDPGSSFTLSCNGASVLVSPDGSGGYEGTCGPTTLSGDYSVTASF